MTSSSPMTGHNGGSKGMAHADSRNSMTSTPHDWKQEQQDRQSTDSVGFWKELFFHYYVIELESELQELKLTKSDIAPEAMNFSRMGHLNLFFRAMSIIGNALFGIVLSIILFLVIAYFLSLVIASIFMILFLYIVIFQKAKIIYSLDQYKLGEKETGAFIAKVRNAWHVFEFLGASIFILFGILYLKDVNYIEYAHLLSTQELSKPFSILYNFIDKNLSVLSIAKKLPDVITYIFGNLSIFFSIYLIGSIFFYNKFKDAHKENLFNLKKEYMHPADLAREKMGF